MAKNINDLFGQAVNQFKTRHDDMDHAQQNSLAALEGDFEAVKDQVRLLKPHIEHHPKFNRFWIFKDRITIAFHLRPNSPIVELVVRLYLPGQQYSKEGMYGYMIDGYEIKLPSVDEAVEFIATQCGKLLA